MDYIACIGTCSVRGSRGIYVLSVDPGAKAIQTLSAAPAVNSGFLALDAAGTHIYTTYENMVFGGAASGGVGAYTLGPTGKTALLNTAPAAGQLPCHISLSPRGDEAYVSSYLNGWLGVHKIAADGAIAPPHHVIRHRPMAGIEPSIHCAMPTPDGRFLCVVDVKLHQIVFYELSSGSFEQAGRLQMPAPYDYRPRQVVFGRDTAYIITEFGSEVLALHYDPLSPDFLCETQRFALYPQEAERPPRAFAACVRLSPQKNLLAASVRGYNLVTTFSVAADGALSRRVFNRTVGDGPRDFNFTPDGKYLLVGGQFSDTMELHQIDYPTGKMLPVVGGFALPSCSCVAFRPL